MFLLRVLAALVKEWANYPRSAVTVHLAKIEPSRRPAELIEMIPAVQRRKAPERSRERIAL
jgi:hypothetical protein